MPPLLVDKDGVTIVIHSREHLPPHIHAIYGEDEALVDIRTGTMFLGNIPSKKLKVVQRWLSEGENRTIVEQNFYELNPGLKLPENKKPKTKQKPRK